MAEEKNNRLVLILITVFNFLVAAWFMGHSQVTVWTRYLSYEGGYDYSAFTVENFFKIILGAFLISLAASGPLWITRKASGAKRHIQSLLLSIPFSIIAIIGFLFAHLRFLGADFGMMLLPFFIVGVAILFTLFESIVISKLENTILGKQLLIAITGIKFILVAYLFIMNFFIPMASAPNIVETVRIPSP